jgi:hypothetical protein
MTLAAKLSGVKSGSEHHSIGDTDRLLMLPILLL